MHLSFQTPFDHVAVMSEFSGAFSEKDDLRFASPEGPLAAFFPFLSSPTTVSCCELPPVTLICTHDGTFHT